MITGGYILEITGNKASNARQGFGIGIRIEDVKESAGALEISYSFQANYREAGNILIKGVLSAKEKDRKKIIAAWKKDGRLPDDFAKAVYTVINYNGCSNGTFIAKVLGLTAPLVPPQVRMR
jgi:hypothetical protein